MPGTTRIGKHSKNATQKAKTAIEAYKQDPSRNPGYPGGDGHYTCSVADWTANMIGPMKMADGKVIQPTHKTAKLEFCTVATWKNKEIQEERLFYDAAGMMKQLGLM